MIERAEIEVVKKVFFTHLSIFAASKLDSSLSSTSKRSSAVTPPLRFDQSRGNNHLPNKISLIGMTIIPTHKYLHAQFEMPTRVACTALISCKSVLFCIKI